MNEQTIADRLSDIKARFDELSVKLSDPAIFSDSDALTKYGREQSELTTLAALHEELQQVDADIALYAEMAESGLDGPDLEDAKSELRRLRSLRAERLEHGRQLLLPKDPND